MPTCSPFADPQGHIFSVAEITQAIKRQLEGMYRRITVRGEISNCKLHSSGHLYFTLKDASAQIAAAMFQAKSRLLARIPHDGEQVIVAGELALYAPRGRYQIIVSTLQFSGLGELLAALHARKLALEQRGWFAAEKKQPLPQHPQRIGIITSPSGSVIQDMLHVFRRRLLRFHLLLNPVRVQGAEAAAEIATAIGQMNHHRLADVLILARGGGSLEDLAPFNSESVAAAIFHSQIPIITAIGHQTDVCIADFVADQRAPTPSAAAEIVSQQTVQLLGQLQTISQRLPKTLRLQLQHRQQQLQLLIKQFPLRSKEALFASYWQLRDDALQQLRLHSSQLLREQRQRWQGIKQQLTLLLPKEKLHEQRQQLQQIEQALALALRYRIGTAQQRLATLRPQQRYRQMQQTIARKRATLAARQHHLHALTPQRLLARGYCIPFSRQKSGSAMLSFAETRIGGQLWIQMQQGQLLTRIEEKRAGSQLLNKPTPGSNKSSNGSAASKSPSKNQ